MATRETLLTGKKRLHVNQHVIKRNNKVIEGGDLEPVITVKHKGGNTYAHRAKILGPSEVVYSPDKPLSCGAKVWVETTAEVELIRS